MTLREGETKSERKKGDEKETKRERERKEEPKAGADIPVLSQMQNDANVNINKWGCFAQ
jgi:hypothetical protein